METEIRLTQTAGAIAIHVGGELLTHTKDGGNLAQRVDRILARYNIKRGSGYSHHGGALVATGGDFRN